MILVREENILHHKLLTPKDVQLGPLSAGDFGHGLCAVPAGSPSRGGDVTVDVSDINQPSLPTLFILLLSLFLSS